MPTDEMWGELLDTMKAISGYLEKGEEIQKEVAIQERAKLDKPPKAQEFQSEITGGASLSNKPTEGIAKEYTPIPENPKTTKQGSIEGSAATMLKANDKDEEEEEEKISEDEGSETSETEDEGEELKSILKDIRDTLSNQLDVQAVTGIVKSEISKALPSAIDVKLDRMLRKQGFTSTRPDVVRLGIDTNAEVRNSEGVKGDIKKSEGEQEADLVKSIEKLAKEKTWQELGIMREKAGLFRPF